jgi:hypothetical protein
MGKSSPSTKNLKRIPNRKSKIIIQVPNKVKGTEATIPPPGADTISKRPESTPARVGVNPHFPWPR